jgi:hypothetical protein
VSLCIIAWNMYIAHYNSLYYPGIVSQAIYPIWSMPSDLVEHTFLSRFDEYYWRSFQHLSLHLLWFSFVFVFFIKWKAMDRFLRIFILWLIAGALMYSVLWFDTFLVHDYYELIYAIPVVFLSISVMAYYSDRVAPRLNVKAQYGIYILMLAFMTVSIYHNQAVMLDRYDSSNINANPAIYEVEPYLRKIGITEADSVFSLPDVTPNVTLAAYGNHGYTTNDTSGKCNMQYWVEHGIKYMIISDSAYIHNRSFEPYTRKLIGFYKGIYIYDISSK